MPQQSLLRIIKRWRRYEQRGDWERVPSGTRGLYVLYQVKADDRRAIAAKNNYEVVYIGIAGTGRSHGIRGRLRTHHQKRRAWTHFSILEVHDNVSGEEIRELECLLLVIFRHDPRVSLENKQKSSKKLTRLQMDRQWDSARARKRMRKA